VQAASFYLWTSDDVQIKRHSLRAQPAVCQIFKYPGMQKSLSDFPTWKLARTPDFSQWLAHLHLLHRPACLTQLSADLLTSHFLMPAIGPSVCCRMAASSDKNIRGDTVFKLGFPWSGSELIDMAEVWRQRAKRTHSFYLKCIHYAGAENVIVKKVAREKWKGSPFTFILGLNFLLHTHFLLSF
jgi:hypothetical protein